MNEPIINPWMIYLITRLDSLSFLYFLGESISFITIVMCVIFVGTSNDDSKEKQSETFYKALNVLKKASIGLICFIVLSALTPTTKEAFTIYAASYITRNNLQLTGEALDNFIDKLIEKISKNKQRIEK